MAKKQKSTETEEEPTPLQDLAAARLVKTRKDGPNLADVRQARRSPTCANTLMHGYPLN